MILFASLMENPSEDEAAVGYLKRVIELDPENEEAKDLLLVIQKRRKQVSGYFVSL